MQQIVNVRTGKNKDEEWSVKVVPNQKEFEKKMRFNVDGDYIEAPYPSQVFWNKSFTVFGLGMSDGER